MCNIKLKVSLLSLLVVNLAAFDAWAEGSYLDRNASRAQVLKALKNTRSISKASPARRAHSRPSRAASKSSRTASRSSRVSARSSRVSAKGSKSKRVRKIVREPLPTSEGNPNAGPASFRLQFQINSAQLDPKTIPFLDTIGELLHREELKGYSFVVEGHTDASGSEIYNRDLSQRRAEAVRNYLVEKHGIDGERLTIRGWGESRLMNGTNPYDAVNRRVTFSAPEEIEAERSVSGAIPAAPEGS
ncbi:OmpA family protein [Candidatus Thiosymbion oneisti]|uniref:OmpA family protein n=1 Tax=Candidatus Thiosymbion oneisti TaxID=589554 RepID=UPI000A9B349A|nr:OmpA family protein [Candidatus Thiosymbion oneisti]